jgi:flagellar basal body-associated protein FliL
MVKEKKMWITGIMAGLVTLITLVATPTYARSISLKDAGIALWIFIVIGAVIILLQLVPAVILFFSFIGTTSGMVFKRKKAPGEEVAEEKVVIPGFEPAPVKK